MRICDDRYNRDRLRYDLAMWMLSLGARPRTIRAGTGLSEDQLRKLRRAYPSVRTYQPQGKVPRHASDLLQRSALAWQGNSIACLFRLLGLIPHNPTEARGIGRLQRAERSCIAYETYRTLYPEAQPRLAFGLAWFVLNALIAQHLVLNQCSQCARLYLDSQTRRGRTSCGCSADRLPLPRHRRSTLRPTLKK